MADSRVRNVLGIDAAWTNSEPSGVALIQQEQGHWCVRCVAPSYQAFLDAASGQPVDWEGNRYAGSEPDIGALLEAASEMGAASVDLVALDIPLARHPITQRRSSDNAISKAFGSKGCSAHSPSAERPGPISDDLMRQLHEQGFELQTARPVSAQHQRAIEVYPHPALLALTNADYRVPYKVGKSGKYWPGESQARRRQRLLDEFGAILNRLCGELGEPGFKLPEADRVTSFSRLKRYEDALDALVCAWVGMRHLQEQTRAYGDESSAIWVPD